MSSISQPGITMRNPIREGIMSIACQHWISELRRTRKRWRPEKAAVSKSRAENRESDRLDRVRRSSRVRRLEVAVPNAEQSGDAAVRSLAMTQRRTPKRNAL